MDVQDTGEVCQSDRSDGTPVVHSLVYLDNAATSFPKPDCVPTAVGEFLRQSIATADRRGYRAFDHGGETISHAREGINALLHAERNDKLIFTLNATDAINHALRVLLAPGSHVVTGPLEHSAVSRTLTAMRDAGRITFDRLPLNANGRLGVEALSRVRDNTRLAVMCYASNVTGDIIVEPELCRALRSAGVLVFLDVSQAVGSVPVDVRELSVDLLAFSAHKALMGPPGIGCLWAKAELDLPPFRHGGIGVKGEDDILIPAISSEYETGTQNVAGLVGLASAVRYIQEIGLEHIIKKKSRITRHFVSTLAAIPGIELYGRVNDECRLPLISFNHQALDPVQAVGPALHHGFGIVSRAGLHCAPWAHKTIGTFPRGTVRVSFGCFTSEDDCERLRDALRFLCRNQLAAG